MNKLMTLTLVLLLASVQAACATLVNGERQQVFFRGGPDTGVTRVQTPDGTYDIENGSGAYLMSRSRSDIPIKVICPNGKSKAGIVETRFDWGWGGIGNILNGGWGWLIDPFVSDAYVISDVSLQGFCDTAAATAH